MKNNKIFTSIVLGITIFTIIILLVVTGYVFKAFWNFPGVGLYAIITAPEYLEIANEPGHEPLADWQPVIGENFIAKYENVYRDKEKLHQLKEKNVNLFVDESIEEFLLNLSHLSWCFSSPCHTDEGERVTVSLFDSKENLLLKAKKGLEYKVVKIADAKQKFHVKLFWFILPQGERDIIVQWIGHDEFLKLRESLSEKGYGEL